MELAVPRCSGQITTLRQGRVACLGMPRVEEGNEAKWPYEKTKASRLVGK